MKKPTGPYLEQNFYYSNLSHTEAFRRLVSTVIQLGANFGGIGEAHLAPGIRDQLFAGIHDQVLTTIAIQDYTTFETYLNSPDVLLIQLLLTEAKRHSFKQKSHDLITCLSVSEQSIPHYSHPVAIWSEDLIFDPGRLAPSEKRKEGLAIYERFKEIIELSSPDYAAITTEYSLENPGMLKDGRESYAFTNFYIRTNFLGEITLQKIKDLYKDAYSESVHDGLYISTTCWLNPEQKEIDSDEASQLSVKVGKYIGNVE
ncbi:hypothetical protein [Xanthocytophaga agilis]|uniref:Uncharacterized protein n=1 Tax=Xanthocytophaga agilis TaxID=3048010 RepID=A0AAE3UEC5_9BACT|nr:hypothetical protein [Xanthocytophaga agilis]MDJ1499398.1 hypothetical protein [Xanthocytophaga agilis]